MSFLFSLVNHPEKGTKMSSRGRRKKNGGERVVNERKRKEKNVSKSIAMSKRELRMGRVGKGERKQELRVLLMSVQRLE